MTQWTLSITNTHSHSTLSLQQEHFSSGCTVIYNTGAIPFSHGILREREKSHSHLHISTGDSPSEVFPDIPPPITHLSTSTSSSQHQLQRRVNPAQLILGQESENQNFQPFTDIIFFSDIEIYHNWSRNNWSLKKLKFKILKMHQLHNKLPSASVYDLASSSGKSLIYRIRFPQIGS